jgi:hypothetical protein
VPPPSYPAAVTPTAAGKRHGRRQKVRKWSFILDTRLIGQSAADFPANPFRDCPPARRHLAWQPGKVMRPISIERLSQQLTAERGRGFTYSNLSRMMTFAERFPDQKIVAALSQQNT